MCEERLWINNKSQAAHNKKDYKQFIVKEKEMCLLSIGKEFNLTHDEKHKVCWRTVL